MKAIVLKDFGSVENFVLEDDFPVPRVEENKILVKIKAAVLTLSITRCWKIILPKAKN